MCWRASGNARRGRIAATRRGAPVNSGSRILHAVGGRHGVFIGSGGGGVRFRWRERGWP